MGCLFACFGACKHRKRRHLVNATHFEDQRFEATEDDLQVYESTKQEETKQPIIVSREKQDEPVICSTKKKVTFDLNVKTHQESPPIEEVTDNLLKHNEKKKEIEKEEEKETPKEIIKLVPNSITPNVVSHVPNNRYQNCAASEDDSVDLGLEGSELGDDSDSDILGSNEKILVQESSESLFSLSIDSRKHVCEVELGEREVNSPMPVCRSPIQEVHSVLNPVENLTQWKVVKARATLTPPSKYQAKENINLMQALDVPFCPVKLSTHSSVLNSNSKKVLDQEMAVDTSLSSWLVEFESETTPMSKTSTVSVGNSPSQNANKPRNHEDRSILAALEVEELQELSPRRSRSQSPDEPIIGTVGSYWSCTGKIMDSDSSSCSQGVQKDKITGFAVQDERVKWGSILPFEARLEKALNIGIAEV